ncbi:hypothetical protein J2T02_001964 [Chitinophaga terrae (ex Kim and Jung 2007)]|uniref:RagB/SusD family nutrient uptake outer membrane protein n=1 Tax=Chitinophaga terrae (ex Kim and Jung 2007) TaxID=408074 RepID=UPI0027868C7F|nr:RagB/SusD family nutrient uptake outer membrane protein [Chitinophaga terrae (ex Kim and Jung 2007)]MDQ0106851.1 hypothetical protein [Chitinophaga terrae (ex Kim and Jung 2007)]
MQTYKFPKSTKMLRYITIGIISSLLFSCKKLVDVKIPNNKLAKDIVYDNEKTAIGILNSIIIDISGTDIFQYGISAMPVIGGLSSDEMQVIPIRYPTLQLYYTNNLSPNSITSQNTWINIYKNIFTLNDAIEGISQTTSLKPVFKNQLLGEAKFFRAWCYFYLVGLYGEVALALTSDYTKNRLLSRSKPEEVWPIIIKDLKESQELLNSNFVDATLTSPSTERVRPTKWAADALLARAYLYTENWSLAESEASKVINNTALFSLDSLTDVFKKNSKESILQAQPTNATYNTTYGIFYIIPDGSAPNFRHPVYLSDHLLNSFEPNDSRKNIWIKSSESAGVKYYYPFKYTMYQTINPTDPLTEYYVLLRISEQYLIRSEARAQQNKLSLALEDLNIIRNRAGIGNSSAVTQKEILDAILHERQVELFAEWGDRWLDLKRRNKIDEVMAIVTAEKGGKWSNFRKYFPINQEELMRNPNLKQTPGY